MASYDTEIAGHSVTIHYQMGGTNQVGVKKPARVKSWALCPVSGKQVAGTSASVGEATRAVEKGLADSIAEAAEAAENTVKA